MNNGWWLVLIIVMLYLVAGCSSQPIVETRTVKELVPVPCKVETPNECKSAYAVDRISVRDDPLTINRAMRIELEERTVCEIKLKAALNGCNAK